jgi:hypothetical protein
MTRSPALLVVALAALAVASPLTATAAADVAQVTVVSPGGAAQTLSLEALGNSEDVVGRSYALRSSGGETTQTVTGFSLGKIVEAAGADPIGFSYLEVQRPAGGAVVLSRHQALDPGAFPEGFPAVYETATGTGFLRPSAGPEDLNATDSFDAPQGVTVVLRKGSPLQVRAKASPLRTNPGMAVAFTAIVDRAGSGERLTYSWYFDDGHSGSGASASHSFAKRGSYDVVVGVTTPGDEVGASAVVTVQVGAPLSGPDRKGGGSDRGASAPDHGAAVGSTTEASPGGGPDTPTPAAQPPPPQPSAKQAPAKADPPAPAGDRVSGVLLSEDSEARPLQAQATPAARTGDPGGEGGGLPGAALGLIAGLGLLGLGGLIEARSWFS